MFASSKRRFMQLAGFSIACRLLLSPPAGELPGIRTFEMTGRPPRENLT